jgi:hypothetical protein
VTVSGAYAVLRSGVLRKVVFVVDRKWSRPGKRREEDVVGC